MSRWSNFITLNYFDARITTKKIRKQQNLNSHNSEKQFKYTPCRSENEHRFGFKPG